VRITLRDRNADLVEQWQKVMPDIESECADIFSSPRQCIVSPANSFGFMDGGIDGVYTARFGEQNTTLAVQKAIRQLPFEELLVGQAVYVATNDEDFPVIISAPTMRVPMRIPPNNVYLATRAAVALALKLGIKELLLPGMGTSVGGVPFDVAAIMMKLAITDAYVPPAFPRSLGEATARHDASLLDTIRRLFS
jgi:O-acetyl-ADP-ribose deacetylase (regulator of RNase III)